jgi:hypothetical protein
MNSLVVLISLSVISILFLIIIRKKGKKSDILSFVSTLIATLIGVLLAVTLSNIENENKEKSDTIKLLNSASNIIDGTYNYTVGLETYVIELEKDSIQNNDSTIAITKSNNPIPYPDLMETIISNELVTKNLTDLATEESDIYTLQFLVVIGYKIKNLPPITLTVKESGVVNVYNIPFGSRGGFKASQVLSFSCPPVPTEEKVHIRIYNTKDESHVILDQEFDGQKGIFWTAEEVK